MRILIVTDAWRPQVNGVVRSLESVSAALRNLGAGIEFLTPEGFATVPLPTYREIRLALVNQKAVARRLENAPIDHIHIATEGPLGFAARRYCLRTNQLFTTSYHTRFPEYIAARTPIPESVTYAVLRRFHNAACGVMVSTASIADDLRRRGFRRLMRWSRGVDHTQFNPSKAAPIDLPRPVFLYAGRLAPEKNIEAFLSLDLPGSKVVVGDGPSRPSLEASFPSAHFAGMQKGDALAAYYASADVFVFPSRTDTFGIVLLEALACGVPVAALPVPGPLDVIGSSGAGVLDMDLRAACLAALEIPREAARAHALNFTWEKSARQFLDNITAARAAAQCGLTG
ncbi:MAG TPA: glycosyltransferase family 1 protein [Methylocella sp.]|nr:glycosyltransferase family 1 protein [Methylocella sp.]